METWIFGLIKAPLGRKIRALEKTFPNYIVGPRSETSNGEEVVISVRNDRDPGGFYSFNTVTNQLTDLGMNRRGWINPEDMAEMQPISFKARDGLEINGYSLFQKEKKTSLWSCCMVARGVRDYWGYDSEVQLLANRGYAVMQLNYRGSEIYGQEFLESGFLKWGAEMQDDLTDGALWAVNKA